MHIPLSWLKEFVSLDVTEKALGELLTLAGLEVDKIEPSSLSFEGVIVGEIQSVEPHPHADQLNIATVFNGRETVQIVCGDLRCAAGMKVALAPIGAILSDRDKRTFKIKKSKLRGIESFGMLCSEEELGLSEKSEGIFVLHQEAPVGVDLHTLFGDAVFDISLTPNLGHCMSVLGIAREMGALLNRPIHLPFFEIHEDGIDSELTIQIEDPNDCFFYTCQKISGIQMGPSPKWMQERLEKGGVRSINGIVDVTNYVMLELGQPLHAFDAKKVQGQTLKVQRTKTPISFPTLDGKTHTIPENVLMIYDAENPLAIAGIMGGASSQITETTTEIILEAAHFHPSIIRKGSKTLSIRSESSIRFERGIDFERVKMALQRATSLIAQMGTDLFIEKRVEKVGKIHTKQRIFLRHSKVNTLLGTAFSLEDIQSLLHRLDMETAREKEGLTVFIPSYRNDITQEIDLVEEVARIYGYNHLPKRQERIFPSTLSHSPLYQLKRNGSKCLIASGLQEIVTCDLISPELAGLALGPPEEGKEAISVLHPSCVDQSILRPSLLPGMLQVAKHNIDRHRHDLCFFELGNIYFKKEGTYTQRLTAGILLTGKRGPHHWEKKGEGVDFFDLKGIVELVIDTFQALKGTIEKACLTHFHPHIQGKIVFKKGVLALLGEVHPHLLKGLKIDKKVWYAEIDLEALPVKNWKKKTLVPLPQFPGSNRDWTFICDQNAPIGTILQAIESFPSKFLKTCECLDLYQGEAIGTHKKSCTVRLLYRNDAETIKQSQVEAEHARLVQEITKKFSHFID